MKRLLVILLLIITSLSLQAQDFSQMSDQELLMSGLIIINQSKNSSLELEMKLINSEEQLQKLKMLNLALNYSTESLWISNQSITNDMNSYKQYSENLEVELQKEKRLNKILYGALAVVSTYAIYKAVQHGF